MLKHNLVQLKNIYIEKNKFLDALIQLGKEQLEVLESDGFTVELFDELVEEQDKLVSNLSLLEEKVEKLQPVLQEEFPKEKDLFEEEVSILKTEIRLMLEKTEELSKLKEIINEKMEHRLSSEKENLKVGRQSSKVAMDYYRNMSGTHVMPAHFMDQKQ